MNNDKHAICKGLASIGICALGCFSVYVSGDLIGAVCALYGLFIILWARG